MIRPNFRNNFLRSIQLLKGDRDTVTSDALNIALVAAGIRPAAQLSDTPEIREATHLYYNLQGRSLRNRYYLIFTGDSIPYIGASSTLEKGRGLGYICAGEVPGKYVLTIKLEGSNIGIYTQGCNNLTLRKKQLFMDQIITIQEFIDENQLPLNKVVGTIAKACPVCGITPEGFHPLKYCDYCESYDGVLITDYYTYE